ncbi:MAG: hypothetical protein FWC32_08190 [Firmicutes bacterium]|nr:hypothetical protein [Bacillota bacterium]
MARKLKKVLSVVVALVMVFAMVVPVAAAPATHRVSGGNPVFLGTELPAFVVFSDGQIGPGGANQDVVVWTADGTGDWPAIKASIIAAGRAPGWMRNGNYDFHGFFYGVGFANAFWGGQNHFFSVEQLNGGWYAIKRNMVGEISGTISNTIFFGDTGTPPPQNGALEVTVNAIQTTVTTTRVEYWQRTITPTYTLTKYVSQNFSSVTATTPTQWDLRTDTTVINANNRNPIHNGNVLHSLTGATYNPLVVRNSNHFAFASLCHATLAADNEIPLVLVVGNNFNQVGNAVVTYADSYLTITFEYELFSGSWGALSFNRMLGVPNNGNIHSIGGNVNNTRNAMIAIGAPTHTAFSHNITTNTVTIPAAEPTAAGNIYLYIHGTFSFLLGEYLTGPVNVETETLEEYKYVDSSVTNPVDIDVIIRDEYNEIVEQGIGSLSVLNLQPGLYTVTFEFEGQVLYQTNVEVVAGETATVTFNYTLPNINSIGETVINWLPDIVLDPVTIIVIVRI